MEHDDIISVVPENEQALIRNAIDSDDCEDLLETCVDLMCTTAIGILLERGGCNLRPGLALLAVYNDSIHVLNALVQAGTPLTPLGIDHDDATLLHHSRSVYMSNRLLELGLSVHDRDSFGRTPLYCYLAEGNVELVNWAVQHDSDVNNIDNYGVTPLFMIDQLKDSKTKVCGNFLLQKGANIELGNWNGETLRSYAERRKSDILLELIKEQDDIPVTKGAILGEEI